MRLASARKLPAVCLILTACCLTPSAGQGAESGTIRFEPVGDQSDVPERYHLAARTFDYTLTPKRDLPVSGIEIAELTFPSPVTSPAPENNTVYAEYFRPKGPGPFPAV